MVTSITVNKQSVSEFLQSGKEKPFLIPDYQRPYAWKNEEVETLFEDIWEFTLTKGGFNGKDTYFLGTIVSYENEYGQQEIIDGQQRITSLLLLLRTVYTKLANGEDSQSKEAQYHIRRIQPTIWLEDKRTGDVDYETTLLTSKVIDNEGNDILKEILKNGEADADRTDNYSRNYRKFQELFDKHCRQTPLKIYDFIYALLDQVIILPIKAESMDTALTIFSTLNDRGLPLSDSDIFKAKIYNHLPDGEKDDFIVQWKSLSNEAEGAHESIQKLFYYYMFYLKAKAGDTSIQIPSMRKYYSENDFERLYAPTLMEDLNSVLNLWKVTNTNYDILDETWDNNLKIRKMLDILMSFPNEHWRYPVIIYYLSHHKKPDFDGCFLAFLGKLAYELMSRFLLMPTANALKWYVYKLNVNIIGSTCPIFEFPKIDLSTLRDSVVWKSRNILRMLLKVHAYGHQDILLPSDWQIEHILPQRWQDSFFPDVDDETVKELVEHIGNKTPFERRLNIIASNGYFAKKQEQYKESGIEVTRALTTAASGDWTLEHIKHRDEMVFSEIVNLMKGWDEEYRSKRNNMALILTEEEEALIRELRRKEAEGFVP